MVYIFLLTKIKLMPKKTNVKRKGISVSIEEGLLQKLDDFCKQNYNASRSVVIEEAVKKFLEGEK